MSCKDTDSRLVACIKGEHRAGSGPSYTQRLSIVSTGWHDQHDVSSGHGMDAQVVKEVGRYLCIGVQNEHHGADRGFPSHFASLTRH